MIVTLTELKTALGISGTTDDALLTRSLTTANALIAGYIGFDLSDTARERTYTTIMDNSRGHIRLPLYPVIEVESLTADGVAVAADAGWFLLPDLGLVQDFPAERYGTSGRYGVRATAIYRAGFVDADMPDAIKQACIDIANAIYVNGGTVPSGGAAGGTGELKSLTMFDAMSMSFDTGAATGSTVVGAEALLESWKFVLDQYRVNQPTMA
jgi:hypothetical protein